MIEKRSPLQILLIPGVLTLTVLAIPLLAMLFTSEVSWTITDFLFAGLLIFGTTLTYKVITLNSETTIYHLAIGAALLSGFLLIWVNLAVGIIGTENNPINLFYFLVILTGIIGSAFTRFQAHGMMITLLCMALVQGIIGVVAIALNTQTMSSIVQIVGLNGFFIALFVFSAILFRFAERKQYPLEL